jgi:hypothetical protein
MILCEAVLTVMGRFLERKKKKVRELGFGFGFGFGLQVTQLLLVRAKRLPELRAF